MIAVSSVVSMSFSLQSMKSSKTVVLTAPLWVDRSLSYLDLLMEGNEDGGRLNNGAYSISR